MAILDVAQIQTLSDALGAADANLQATLDPGTSTTAAAKMAVARALIHDQMGTADIDDADTFFGVLRTAEKGIQARIDPTLTATTIGLNTYVKAQTGNALRVQYASGVSWSDAFRTLWRRGMKEELIVRLGSLTKASGSWGAYTADKAITLDTAVEVRAGTTIGAAAITLNITFAKSTAATTLVVVTIPASTPAGTTFAVTGTFTSVSSVTISGGTNADRVDIYTK